MNTSPSSLFVGCLAGLLGLSSLHAATTQAPGNVIGTGEEAWSYLILEGEDYDTKAHEDPETGFTRVNATGSITSFLGNPVLGPDTTASKKGALWTQTIFSQHIDQVTYNVQFSRAGTYYLYMRFSMFENGGNESHYLNEDSFFVPPDFDAHPQTDWPLSDRGGYVEGCCDAAGYLFFLEDGVRVSHANRTEGEPEFWEGKFYWNDLLSSQFLDPETAGEPAYRFQYDVPESRVGQPLTFTISYREGGTAIDLFLFSTAPDLMTRYTQEELDALLLTPSSNVTVQDPGNVIGTGEEAWSYLILEGEDYDTKIHEDPETGFTRVDASGSITSFLGNPVLGPDTTASKKGALWTQTIFSQHIDQVTYNVQFSRAGTYYLYMRFSMFENGGNESHYLNEDSFFVPPDFDAHPQTDWPLSDRGGYVEGCCDAAGYLFFLEDGVRVSHANRTEGEPEFWEGKFYWNDLLSSQFLDPETAGEPAYRFQYDVPESRVGQPLTFTISYREGGTAIDLFLFSTAPDLMTRYTQEELDALLLAAPSTPTLEIAPSANGLAISWPASFADYVLQDSDALSPTAWQNVTAEPVVEDGRKSVTITPGDGDRYYRLLGP